MKKLKMGIMALAFIFVLSACGGSKSKLETVTYGLKNNGVTLQLEMKYDKDKTIQETTANNTYVYKDMNRTKEDLKKSIDTNSTMYKDMKGVKRDVSYGDTEAKETIHVVVKDVSKEDLKTLYGNNFDDKDNLSLDKLVKTFEKLGYTKK
ncbi:DUF1307 domain-containing protein [Vagococcus silagei]|uniref:DUF1307 domain-containing protein n=1 Tax=Vagococcus silagei TaxID=2508885 RepID=A0A4S3B3F7_9ENTE|nr:DUF1307 domain-containing protein [Vagococcus silagei]THB60290.1 DUF1307 domain-containing protein [Vagococcus silagei]